MSDIKWEDPPMSTTSYLQDLLEEVKRHPNKWANILHYSSASSAASTASRLRHERRRVPSGRWEFASRRGNNGDGYLYAKYLGPQK